MRDDELVRAHVTNGHTTSGGKGPGVLVLPLSEARELVARRWARILGPAGEEGDRQAARALRGVSN
jgi:hypothetical protein